MRERKKGGRILDVIAACKKEERELEYEIKIEEYDS